MKEFIAHENQTLKEHLINVATLSRKNSLKIGLPLIGELCGLLHDFGKYSLAFQNYLSSALGVIEPDEDDFVDSGKLKGKIDHSTAGAQYFWNNFTEFSKTNNTIRNIISLIIASHHSGLIDTISPQGEDKLKKRIKKEDKHTHLKEVSLKSEDLIIKRVDEIISSEDLIKEFTIVEKKIRRISPTTHFFQRGLLTRYLFSSLIDADRTDSANSDDYYTKSLRLNANYPSWGKFIELLEIKLSKFENKNNVDELRIQISKECYEKGKSKQAVFSLTVPTGGGKTLASLRFALEHCNIYGLDRIIYVIPYTSIIDQNVKEIQKIFAPLSKKYGTELVLEHHSNLTPNDRTKRETTTQKLLSENWDSPIIFTTSVQLLETLFSGGTRSARRMHQLAKSVIIFDEIQTLPLKTVHLFNNAMNFLVDVCKSSVVLCTATQPLLDKVNAGKGAIALKKENELISNITSLYRDLKRVEVVDKTKAGGWSTLEVANLVEDELISSRSVLVIVNTKKSAKDLYLLCKDLEAIVFHLSTDMCPAHRINILDEIRDKLDNDEKIICISTQLIEAGVDVDFGSVIRYLAGLDSIAQAAGRCNRNGIRDIGFVSVVDHAIENIDRLPEIKIGQEISIRIFNEFKTNPQRFNNSLLSPQAIEQYFKYYFFARQNEMSYFVSSDKNAQDDTLLEMLSKNEKAVRIYGHSEPLPQSFASAGKHFNVIDSVTQGVIVPFGRGKEIITQLCASKEISKEFELMKEAQRYSVNCYEHTLKTLDVSSAIYNIQDSGIFYLNEEHYSLDFGLATGTTKIKTDSSSYCL